MKIKRRSPLKKRANRGFHGYPLATIAFYGPDDSRASKLVVSIIPAEDAEPTQLERWFSDETDLRNDPTALARVQAFIRDHSAKTVTMPDRIIGCPHEEGVDYPEGEVCPQCPFWAHRDRWTGEIIH